MDTGCVFERFDHSGTTKPIGDFQKRQTLLGIKGFEMKSAARDFYRMQYFFNPIPLLVG
jgi:hypothetical protein